MQETVSKLLESFYIDNCITSVDSEELNKFIAESKFILERAKFDLREWEHNYFSPSINVSSSEIRSVPVLGLQWQLYSDRLSIDLREDTERR